MRNNSGYIYILINPLKPNFVKIGKTQVSAEDEAKKLSSNLEKPNSYIVIYDCYFEDYISAEKYIYELLKNKGFEVSSKNDYFQIPIKESINTLIATYEYFNIEQEIITHDISYKEKVSLSEDEYLYDEEETPIEEIKKAIEDYKIEIQKGDISCYSTLATLYFKLGEEQNCYDCWQKYFTLNKDIKYIDGVNYLKFIAVYPHYKIQFIDKLKDSVDEIIENLHNSDLLVIDGAIFELTPTFIEYVKNVLNGVVKQEGNNLYRDDDEGLLQKLFS